MIDKVVIGSATLIHADCRDVLPLESITDGYALVTDPPYGNGFAAQPTRYQRANNMKPAAWDHLTCQMAVDLARLSAWECVIWGGNYYQLPPSRGWLIWAKTGNAPSMADCEMAWTDIDMNARIFNKSVKSASLEKDLQREPHPTQKPIALMEWSIGFCQPERMIIDPFMGTGTTGVACANLRRPFIGIEIERAYFDIACTRIDQAQRQGRLCP